MAVIDSGFNPKIDHEFQHDGTFIVTYLERDSNGVFQSNGASGFRDTSIGHGTKTSGIIAGVNDGSQFSGVLNSLFQADEQPARVGAREQLRRLRRNRWEHVFHLVKQQRRLLAAFEEHLGDRKSVV